MRAFRPLQPSLLSLTAYKAELVADHIAEFPAEGTAEQLAAAHPNEPAVQALLVHYRSLIASLVPSRVVSSYITDLKMPRAGSEWSGAARYLLFKLIFSKPGVFLTSEEKVEKRSRKGNYDDHLLNAMKTWPMLAGESQRNLDFLLEAVRKKLYNLRESLPVVIKASVADVVRGQPGGSADLLGKVASLYHSFGHFESPLFDDAVAHVRDAVLAHTFKGLPWKTPEDVDARALDRMIQHHAKQYLEAAHANYIENHDCPDCTQSSQARAEPTSMLAELPALPLSPELPDLPEQSSTMEGSSSVHRASVDVPPPVTQQPPPPPPTGPPAQSPPPPPTGPPAQPKHSATNGTRKRKTAQQ
jgi:hypothetical protein